MTTCQECRFETQGDWTSCSSLDYNYSFNNRTGQFLRWGRTYREDPQVAPFPEILDLEATTICGEGCPFCYKKNTSHGKNMSLKIFETILSKMPRGLTQIAFGADSGGVANPELLQMMWMAREWFSIVPNVTLRSPRQEILEKYANVCGAIALSWEGFQTTESLLKILKRKGLRQANIHYLLDIFSLKALNCPDCTKDFKRLADEGLLNALVFLSLKQKGRGVSRTPISSIEFKAVINNYLDKGIPIGLDSCSAPKFLEAIKDRKEFDQVLHLVEPCESTLFSGYINVEGKFFPCSFTEGTPGWEEGLGVVNCRDFIQDIWLHPRTIEFREKLLANNRHCPIYEV